MAQARDTIKIEIPRQLAEDYLRDARDKYPTGYYRAKAQEHVADEIANALSRAAKEKTDVR